MALNFPDSPTLGQNFTSGGILWTWDGVKWQPGGIQQTYLPLAGGTMTGPIVLAADPTAALQPSTKQYTDGARWGDNRIINGDMWVDQRNTGAAGTVGGYTCDRWGYFGSQASKGSWQRSGPYNQIGLPFAYILQFTSSSAYTLLANDNFQLFQQIEADQISDFQWGTAAAQPVTLSFWAYSSFAGTFGGAVGNYAGNRAYPFSYSLPAATWTKIIITIPGDTGGTWVMSGNGGGVSLHFDLGSGANLRGPAGAWANGNWIGANGTQSIVSVNGALFAVTGVKLEIGSFATPFNHQSLAKRLADCQRYHQVIQNLIISGYTAVAGQSIYGAWPLSPPMRAAPTLSFTGVSYGNASSLQPWASTPTVWGAYCLSTVIGSGFAVFITSSDAEL